MIRAMHEQPEHVTVYLRAHRACQWLREHTGFRAHFDYGKKVYVSGEPGTITYVERGPLMIIAMARHAGWKDK